MLYAKVASFHDENACKALAVNAYRSGAPPPPIPPPLLVPDGSRSMVEWEVVVRLQRNEKLVSVDKTNFIMVSLT